VGKTKTNDSRKGTIKPVATTCQINLIDESPAKKMEGLLSIQKYVAIVPSKIVGVTAIK